MEWLAAAILLGLLPAAIAHHKGHSFALFWMLGAIVFIVALPLALMIRPDNRELERRAAAEGQRKCPFCAEWVKGEARVCRHCGRDLPPEPPRAAPAPAAVCSACASYQRSFADDEGICTLHGRATPARGRCERFTPAAD